jgi:hypothetical protein
MRPTTTLMRAAVIALLSVACGDAAPSDVSTTDSAGVEIVMSTAPDRQLPWTFTEVLRIGGADSGIGSFTAASPAVVQTNGHNRITVLDRDRSVIEVFDGNGTLLGAYGAKGSGPGEFSFVLELLDLGEGEIGVFDFTKMAAVRWSASGQVLPELRGRPEARVWRGDTAWVSINVSDTIRTVSGVGVVVGTDTMALDTLVTPPRKMTTLSCFSAMLPPMFTGRMVWDYHDGLVAATRQSTYAVQLYQGPRLTHSIRRAIEPIPTTPDMAERQYPEGWTVSFGSGGGCTMEPSEVAEKLGMASHLPVLNNVAFGPRGTLWVERHVFPGEPPVTDVFDREGAYLGTVNGKGLPLGWLGDDRVLFAIEDDATGVSVIGVFRMTESTNEAASS